MPARQVKSYSLDLGLIARINKLALAEGVSASSLVERLLLEALQPAETAVQFTANPVLMNAMMKLFTQPEMVRAMTSTIKQDLTDDQLELFAEGMQSLTNIAERGPRRIASGPTKRASKTAIKKGKKK
jgi:hypothetical protein